MENEKTRLIDIEKYEKIYQKFKTVLEQTLLPGGDFYCYSVMDLLCLIMSMMRRKNFYGLEYLDAALLAEQAGILEDVTDIQRQTRICTFYNFFGR